MFTVFSVIGWSCHKYSFCRNKHVFGPDKSMLVTTKLLSRKTCFCRDKHVFVATIKCLSRQYYVCCDKYLLRQLFFGHDKHIFVATKDVFCRDKDVFVVLSRQKYLWQLPPMIVFKLNEIKYDKTINLKVVLKQ